MSEVWKCPRCKARYSQEEADTLLRCTQCGHPLSGLRRALSEWRGMRIIVADKNDVPHDTDPPPPEDA